MVWAVLNKSYWQHPLKQLLYSHLLTITETIEVRRTRHPGRGCWNWNEFRSKDLFWARTKEHIGVSRVAQKYIHKLCANTGYRLEELSREMDDRDGLMCVCGGYVCEWERERGRERDISYITRWYTHTHTHTQTYIYIYIYIYHREFQENNRVGWMELVYLGEIAPNQSWF